MKVLQQNVPLGYVGADGKTVSINREFGDKIESLASGTSQSGGLSAAVVLLQSQVASLSGSVASLLARVKALEDGYQS